MIASLIRPFFGYVSLGLAALCLVLFLAFKIEQRHARKLDRRVTELVELRQADRARYEGAQAQAKAINQATVQKIEAENEKITNRIGADYRRNLERLRSQAAKGAAGRADLPKASEAPGGTDADGMPNSGCDLLCAQEIELRLLHLQDWVREQAR